MSTETEEEISMKEEEEYEDIDATGTYAADGNVKTIGDLLKKLDEVRIMFCLTWIVTERENIIRTKIGI